MIQEGNFRAKTDSSYVQNSSNKNKYLNACGALYQLYYKLLARQSEPKFDWRTKQRSQWINRENYCAHACFNFSWRRLLKLYDIWSNESAKDVVVTQFVHFWSVLSIKNGKLEHGILVLSHLIYSCTLLKSSNHIKQHHYYH